MSASESPKGVRFHSATTGLQGSIFGNHTLREVLEQDAGGGDYATLGSYIVAALLNAKAGLTPFLDEATVRQMWNDLLAKGHYAPVPGMQWGAGEIVAYLKSTMS